MKDVDLFNLYMEIIAFLHSGGGPYRVMNGETQDDVIDALYSGQYVLLRNEEGRIVSFCTYWLIHPDDLLLVRNGGRPQDVSSGSILFVSNHVSQLDGIVRSGLAKELRKRCPDVKGCAWFHRWAKPENFRYYPSQRGKHG